MAELRIMQTTLHISSWIPFFCWEDPGGSEHVFGMGETKHLKFFLLTDADDCYCTHDWL